MRFNGTVINSGYRNILAGAGIALTLVVATTSCSGPRTRSESYDRIPGGGELGVNLPMQVKDLPNGLRVIMVEDHTVPVVSYQTWYKVGSVDEKPGYTGMAHLFEHLMFKGTPRYPEKQFFLQLEAKGAEVNAYTTRDYTVYYENFIPTLLPKVIDMESDRMAHLTLNDQVLNSERMVVLEERRLRTENSPEGKMQEALWHLAYRVHPYRWPVVGFPPDLFRIKTPDLMKFFHAHYQPANAAIVIVGDFDATRTMALIQKDYGVIPRHNRPKRDIPAEPKQDGERRLVLHDDVTADRMMEAYHVGSAIDNDTYALDVLSNILFEGTNSRAYRQMVEKTNVALSVSGTDYTPTYPGLFIAAVSLQKGHVAAEAEDQLHQLIRQVQDQGVTEDEVKAAIRQLTVQMVDSVQTPYGLGTLIGTVQTILGDPKEFARDLSKYLKVTPADVKRVANQYLTPNNRTIVTLVPKSLAAGTVPASTSSGKASK